MEKQWVEIYSVPGQLNAAMIVDLLKAYGIDATSLQESAGVTYGLVLGSLGEARIFVPREFKEQAEDLLRRMEAGELTLPDDQSLFPDIPDDQTGSNSD